MVEWGSTTWIIAIANAEEDGLVEVEQVLALKPLDEVGGDQALPPVQDLPVEEAILINNSIHHRWWRKEKRIEGKDGMENILFLFNDTPPPRKI